MRVAGGSGKSSSSRFEPPGPDPTPPPQAVWPPCASACPAVRGPQDRSLSLGCRAQEGQGAGGGPDLPAASPSFSGYGISRTRSGGQLPNTQVGGTGPSPAPVRQLRPHGDVQAGQGSETHRRQSSDSPTGPLGGRCWHHPISEYERKLRLGKAKNLI